MFEVENMPRLRESFTKDADCAESTLEVRIRRFDGLDISGVNNRFIEQ